METKLTILQTFLNVRLTDLTLYNALFSLYVIVFVI
jgi:hypothetical protein